MIWIIVVGMVLLLVCIFVVAYRIDRQELGVARARKRLLILGPIIGLIVSLPFGLVLYANGSRTSPVAQLLFRYGSTFFLVAGCIYLVTVAVLISLVLRQRLQAGPQILDLGRLPRQNMMIIVAGLMALSGIGQFAVAVSASASFARELIGLIQIMMACYFVYLGLTHQEIHERGIIYYGGLIPWNRVLSYSWEEQQGRWISMTIKRNWPTSKTITIRLPVISLPRTEVEQTLGKYLGGAPA